MNVFLLRSAAVSGALAVALGAFGAHSLKESLAPEMLHVFETGVMYQIYHTMALLACGALAGKFTTLNAGRFFISGMFAFSGSLYLLSTRSLLGIETWKWLGPITPLGGLCFIIGWVLLFAAFGKKQTNA
jgi:uncharacterized membrane protein YgdD (TMEM256/DUF423 family)